MKKINFLLLAAILFVSVISSSCKREDETPELEQEVITTVIMRFIEVGSTTVNEFIYRDLDGDGPATPTRFDAINLKPNTEYMVSIQLLDESKNPAEDINEEIMEEGDEHQFFFEANPANLISEFEYLDTDEDGRPIGLVTRMVTGTAHGEGNLRVVLLHELNKAAAGVAAGNRANAGGDVDVDINFPFALHQ
jgi:hypothetical protein